MKRRDLKSTTFTLIAAAMSLGLTTPTPLAAQSNALQRFNYKVLHTFTGQLDGATPYTGAIADDAGNVYGTAAQGGDLSCNAPYGCGVVFKVDPASQFTVVHAFHGGTDGALLDGYSGGGLTRDHDGNLYGTTAYGGDPNCQCGLVFKIDRQGNYSVLHTFTGPDGLGPSQTLLLGSDGNLYGTTFQGGTHECGGYGCGAVFKMDLQGNPTLLYSFRESGGDGNFPGSSGPLAQDLAGNLYGATGSGGAYNQGVVFKIDPQSQDHRETVLYTFTGGTDGGQPAGSVALDDAGNIYGSANTGVLVYKLDPNGHETVLYNFTGGTDGGQQVYSPVIRDNHGNLYGMTFGGGDLNTDFCGDYGCGVVYKLYPGGRETVLYAFQATDGALPYAGVFRDRNGSLYGTTGFGGDLNTCFGNGCGVVFKLSACNSAICRGQN